MTKLITTTVIFTGIGLAVGLMTGWFGGREATVAGCLAMVLLLLVLYRYRRSDRCRQAGRDKLQRVSSQKPSPWVGLTLALMALGPPLALQSTQRLSAWLTERQRIAYESELGLRVQIGDAYGNQFSPRRQAYDDARQFAVRRHLNPQIVDQALARLEQELAASRPVPIDHRIRFTVIGSQLDAATLFRTIDVRVDSPDGVVVPELTLKDVSGFTGQIPVLPLAVGRLVRPHQKLQLALFLDISTSMSKDRLEQSKRGAGRLVQTLSPSAEISIYAFRDVVTKIADAKSDTRVALSAIGGLQAQGGTAILLAGETGVRDLSQRPAPRALVLFTDGKDSVGGRSREELLRLAHQHQVAIHAIGLETAETDFDLLRDLAEQTGGSFRTGDVGQLEAQFVELAKSLSRPVYRFVLPATPPGEELQFQIGDTHRVRVPLATDIASHESR